MAEGILKSLVLVNISNGFVSRAISKETVQYERPCNNLFCHYFGGSVRIFERIILGSQSKTELFLPQTVVQFPKNHTSSEYFFENGI